MTPTFSTTTSPSISPIAVRFNETINRKDMGSETNVWIVGGTVNILVLCLLYILWRRTKKHSSESSCSQRMESLSDSGESSLENSLYYLAYKKAQAGELFE